MVKGGLLEFAFCSIGLYLQQLTKFDNTVLCYVEDD